MAVHGRARRGLRALATTAGLALAGLWAGAAPAQEDLPPPGPTLERPAPAVAPAAASSSVVEDLIHHLVRGRTLPQSDADQLLARLKAGGPGAQDIVTEDLIRTLVEHRALEPQEGQEMLGRLKAQAPAAAPSAAAEEPPAGGPNNETRVTYVPESVKQKLREQIKQEVLAQAKAEGWAAPRQIPDWLNRIAFYGDFRYRQEFDFYNSANSPFFIDFNAINSGSPFDVTLNNTSLPPLLDTTQNRIQPRFRLRLGMVGHVTDGLDAVFRFTSGNTTNPVSTNQTLGSDFNKYTLVIDRAYLSYHPVPEWQGWIGRLPKPFLSTNLLWWDDLSFDGAAVQYRADVNQTVFAPFLTLGAFSVENTALNFPSTSSAKVGSRDKWLLSGQLGLEIAPDPELSVKTAIGYYYFYHLEGELSAPCIALTASDSCDSDETRPGFIQKGNTLFAIRNLLPPSPPATGPLYQFFGLSSPFREVDLVSVWDFHVQGAYHAIFTADFEDNVAYSGARIRRTGPVNNLNGSTANTFEGGGSAFQLQLKVGEPRIRHAWEWNVTAGYKRVQSDAVVDAFDDPDFFATDGVGGTNDKGYFIIANVGLLERTWLSARYFAGQQITGPPLQADIVQIDLNASF